MQDSEKDQNRLLEELIELRQRVAALEAAEKLRQDHEAWAEQLLDAAPLGIHECDTEGRITFVNPAQEAITGYSAEELLGTYVWDRMEPGSQQETMPALLKSLAAGQSVPAPFFARNIRKNGELFDVRVDWSYKRDSAGQVVGFVSVISDVTEQKRLERELRKSQAMLRATIDCLPFDFFALGSDGRYILQNAPSKCIWGEIVGKLPEEICEDRNVLAVWLENGRLALAGEKIKKEVTYSLHGEEHSYLALLAPIQDDLEMYGILGVNVDLTDRKRAEESLRQSEQRYRMLTESTTDMIFILNRSGDVLYANPSAAAGIRYDADSLVGLRQDELFSPEKVKKHIKSIAGVFETGKVYDADGMYRFGGEEIWINTRLMPLRDENGTVTAVMGVTRNITPRKRAEAALQQAHDELEKRVEERTAELTKANKALTESEAKYRHLVETTDTGYLILDDQGRVVDANDEYVRLTGRRMLSEIIGRTVVEWTAPCDVHRNAAEVAKCLKAGTVRQLEIDYVGPDGKVIPVEINASVVTGKQGRRIISLCRDITDRKRAEEALRQSEQKYKGLVEASPDAVIIADVKGTVLFASHHTWEFLGCSDEEDLVGRSAFDFIVENDRPRLAANIADLMKSRMRKNTEYTARRKDGTTFPVEISAAAGPNTERQPWAVLAVVRDISERKQAEETLRQSEEKYHGLVDICPDSIVVTDLAGKALFVSKQTWKLLGIPEQVELVGQSVFRYVTDADRPRLAANIADLIAAGRQKNEDYTALRPDGSTVPVELSSALIRDARGQPMALMAMIRDISERKQAEQALQQHYEELRAIYDGMADGLVILDMETAACIRVNRSLCDMLGYSQEELKALSPDILHPPALLPKLREKYRAILEGRASHTEDIPFVRKDGGIVYVDITSDQITYNGRPSLIHLLRDTTERRQTQEALKKEHRTLKHLLRSSDHERQLIAYEIHDGLAQQLAGALMQIETYWHQKDARPQDAAKAYDAAVTMLRQAHFETRRLISGVRPPILDESGVVAAVAHLVNEQRLQYERKIEFRGEVSFRRLVPILENAVYRIVQEALANACQHSKSDRVRVEMVQCDDVLRVKVQDWGVGFDPAAVREDHFGLEGIRERVRLLGGSTIIESSPTQGTSVTVELPLVLRED